MARCAYRTLYVWALVCHGRGPWLFDLQEDPLEMINLANSAEARAVLQEWKKDCIVGWKVQKIHLNTVGVAPAASWNWDRSLQIRISILAGALHD